PVRTKPRPARLPRPGGGVRPYRGELGRARLQLRVDHARRPAQRDIRVKARRRRVGLRRVTRFRDDVAALRAETHRHRSRRWWVSARHAAVSLASRARRLNPPYVVRYAARPSAQGLARSSAGRSGGNDSIIDGGETLWR